MNFKYNVAVIGIGRVGLPLSLSLASKGLKVVGVDINEEVIQLVNQKVFPFMEEGYEDLIRKVEFFATSDYSVISDSEHIVITVGTPLMGHIETDLSHIIKVLKKLTGYLREGQHLILRSTIAPKTTLFVKNYLEAHTRKTIGQNLFLTFCPERMAEGKSYVELETLPQIIGSQDDKSAQKAEWLFRHLVQDILHTDFVSAELVKLFNNISRYIYFAMANQFTIIAEQNGVNIHRIIEMSNYKYPRGVIPKPGLTAGTCLRKDFGMINETIPFTDLLLSAWKVNEYMPKFLVEGVKSRGGLLGKKVAVLGYTFKQDVDDVRDSLVPKLLRYIFRENPASIKVNDPYLEAEIEPDYPNYSIEECLHDADVVFLAINHTPYKERFAEIINRIKPDAVIADLWNISGTGGVFLKKEDFK